LIKKNYTSKDVADLAGVSQATVSRVFAGETRVSERKKKLVMEAADKLNYQPNAHARSLTTRKTKIIGIVMRNIRDPFYTAVLEIFHNRLTPLGYQLIFINSENEVIEEAEIKKMLEYNIAGVVITDAVLSKAASEKFKHNEIPVLLFNRYTKEGDHNSVFCDNYHAAKQIASYLLKLGHQSFGFISGPSNTSTTIDRLKGFTEVLDQNNIHDLIIASGDYTYHGGFNATQELITRNMNLDCIFCVNDITALGAMDAIRTMGFKIPEDISVVGFDNIRMCGWTPYFLSTWEQPLEDMVTRSVEILLERIADYAKKPEKLRMIGQLIVRNSVKSKR
jgi:DNA-binding LacI/PurR family transcriptional regulator